MNKYGGYVPITVLGHLTREVKQMATIRMNRARGTHAVLNMAKIVTELLDSGMEPNEICGRLQMEKEELIRLSNRNGIALSDIVTKEDWSKAWVPKQ